MPETPEQIHVELFYEGCLLNQGKITREDKKTARLIKDTIAEIDRLKR